MNLLREKKVLLLISLVNNTIIENIGQNVIFWGGSFTEANMARGHQSNVKMDERVMQVWKGVKEFDLSSSHHERVDDIWYFYIIYYCLL